MPVKADLEPRAAAALARLAESMLSSKNPGCLDEQAAGRLHRSADGGNVEKSVPLAIGRVRRPRAGIHRTV
jgi:hypothetical protein